MSLTLTIFLLLGLVPVVAAALAAAALAAAVLRVVAPADRPGGGRAGGPGK